MPSKIHVGCAPGSKVPGLPWKDQATALKVPLNQIGNAFCPLISGKNFVPCKVGPPTLLCCPGRSFSPRKRGSLYQLPQVPLALCAIILELRETYVQFSHRQNQNLHVHYMFVSYVKPHNPVTAPTLNRWLRVALKNAGIDTDIPKAISKLGLRHSVTCPNQEKAFF